MCLQIHPISLERFSEAQARDSKQGRVAHTHPMSGMLTFKYFLPIGSRSSIVRVSFEYSGFAYVHISSYSQLKILYVMLEVFY